MRSHMEVYVIALLVFFVVTLAAFPIVPENTQREGNVNYVYEKYLMGFEKIQELKEKVGVRDPNKNYNIIVEGHGTGLAPPSEEEYEKMKNIIYVESVRGYTSRGSVDLSTSPYFPPVGNQKQQGSCTAWATDYYVNTYMQAKIRGWDDTHYGTNSHHLMSPAWNYNKVNGGKDEGSSFQGNYNLLKSVGSASLATMPYDDSDYISWGEEAAWREAPLGRITNYESTDVSNINVIKSWLDEGYLVNFAINADAYQNGFSDGNYILSWTEYQSYAGSPNHAQTIVGYDDSVSDDGDVGAFKIVNSWGSSWGDNGFYWFTYEAFSHLGYNFAFRVIIDEPNNPHLLATWEFSSAGARDASVKLGIGDINSPQDTREPIWDGGAYNFPSFMALDIGDFYNEFSNGNHNFFLCIGTESSGSSSSVISSFKIEYYADNYNPEYPTDVSDESPDVPKTTPCCVTNRYEIKPLSIVLLNPRNGDLYRGGEEISILWNVSSQIHELSEITVRIYYAYNGSSWQLIDEVSGDASPYDWSLPVLNSTSFQIKVNASDPDSNSDESSAIFTVDSEAPSIISVYPEDGSTGVSRYIKRIYLNFSEAVNISTLHIGINPNISYSIISDDNGTHLAIVPGYLEGNMEEGKYEASANSTIVTAQTFHVSEDVSIYYVELYLRKIGNPPANATLEIKEVDASGIPTGAALAHGEVSPSMVGDTFSWVSFILNSSVSLEGGKDYALVLSMPSPVGDTSDRYKWSVTENTYSGGKLLQYSNGQWNVYQNYDTGFILHSQILDSDTIYTVTVTQGLQDLAGNEMQDDYSFQFSTGSQIPELSLWIPLLILLLAIVVSRRK